MGLSDLDAVNEVCTRFFPDFRHRAPSPVPPAFRTVVEVAAELPMHALVQDRSRGVPTRRRHACWRWRPVGLIIEANNTPNAPSTRWLSTQSVAFSHYNNISGTGRRRPASGKLVAGGVPSRPSRRSRTSRLPSSRTSGTMEDAVKANASTT